MSTIFLKNYGIAWEPDLARPPTNISEWMRWRILRVLRTAAGVNASNHFGDPPGQKAVRFFLIVCFALEAMRFLRIAYLSLKVSG